MIFIQNHILAKNAAQVLAAQADDAKKLLEDYNKRLAMELDERKATAKQLRKFINAQKQALTDSERELQVNF